MCNETLISYTPSQNVFSLQKNSQRRKENKNKRIMIKKKNKKAYFLSQTRQKSEHKKR